MSRRKLERRFRIVLGFFMLALIVSGVTAFPLLSELRILAEVTDAPTETTLDKSDTLPHWIGYVYQGLRQSYDRYPFIAYGTDWLAFAHIVIAVFFVGPLLRPAEYSWTLISGMIACLGVLPLALICGPMRGIPFYWQLVDCSFGIFGILPLAYCYALHRKLNKLSESDA